MKLNRSAFIDLLLFITTLYCAWVFQWRAGDLVWSLWASSLTIGYITLIFGPLIQGIQKFPLKTFLKDMSDQRFRNDLFSAPTSKGLMPVIGVVVAIVVFLVGFFTIHFGMFHFIHGSFLSSFFPLEGLTYPHSPWDLPRFAIHMAGMYWPFVLSSAISQFFRLNSKSEETVKGSDFFVEPYKSVIRMHFMIFVFALLHYFKADNFMFYAVILLFYFMPWSIFRRKKIPTTTPA